MSRSSNEPSSKQYNTTIKRDCKKWVAIGIILTAFEYDLCVVFDP